MQPAGQRQGDDKRQGGCGEENAVAVPRKPQPVGMVLADGVNEQAPADGRQAERDVAEHRVDGEEMVAAHRRDDGHGQPVVGHLDERGKQAHEELQGDDQRQAWRQRATRHCNPTAEDEQPQGIGKNQHGLAAQVVQPRAEKPQAAEPAEEHHGGDVQDFAFAHAGFGL